MCICNCLCSHFSSFGRTCRVEFVCVSSPRHFRYSRSTAAPPASRAMVGSAASFVDLSSPPSPLPMWAQHRLPVPPTLWGKNRAAIFDAFTSDEKFELFRVSKQNHTFKQRNSMTCGICKAVLYNPAVCQQGCAFLACIDCWREHFAHDNRCPQCRCVQPDEPSIAKHLIAIIDEEMKAQGVVFECNADVVGEHSCAMWCCRRRFKSLNDLRAHLVESGSFIDTRLRCTSKLRAAIAGNLEARQAIFEDLPPHGAG